MSAKFSNTTADYLEWNQAMNLIRKLYDDGEYQKSLLISIGCFMGLRISDILKLRFNQIIDVDELIITEKKTGKTREIKINHQLKKHISACVNHINPVNYDDYIFISQKGTVFSIQRINIILKEIKTKYSLRIKNFSSHSLRKTMGREIFERAGNNGELALIKLGELFNHSSPAITKRYLGITREEMMDTYDLLGF